MTSKHQVQSHGLLFTMLHLLTQMPRHALLENQSPEYLLHLSSVVRSPAYTVGRIVQVHLAYEETTPIVCQTGRQA